MSDEFGPLVSGDSVSKNVFTEAISRILVYVGGIVSSALLVRAINDSSGSIWQTADYAHLKVLMSWNQILTVIVLMGLTTAIIKSVSENTGNRNAIGTIISSSMMTVTAIFLLVAIATTFFAEPLGFLISDTPETTLELRTLWFLVVISMLPSAYIQIASSTFSGLQRMQRSLIVGIVYNSSRIVILLLLFFTQSIAIITVLWMFLITSILGGFTAYGIMIRELKKEGIQLGFSEWNNVARPLFAIASAFLVLALVAAFFNSASTLFVDYFGSDSDVARFSIAQSVTLTIRSFLYTPFAILLPNLSGMFARGETQVLKKRFEESNRIIVPSLIFTFAIVISFAHSILGLLYGLRGIDSSGGLSAVQFLYVLSVNLLILPATGIYSNLLTALGKLRVMVGLGITSVLMQALWIILLQPHFGVIVIAYLWVIYIPLFLAYHFYCRKHLSLNLSKRFLLESAIVGILFLPVAYFTSMFAYQVSSFIPIAIIQSSTTLQSLIQLAFAIPLWYVFIGISLAVGLMKLDDIENLKRVLQKIPPAWWISKPLIEALVTLTKRGLIADSADM